MECKEMGMQRNMDEAIRHFEDEKEFGIREINRMARERGLTYGQMVAVKYAENVKIIKPPKYRTEGEVS